MKKTLLLLLISLLTTTFGFSQSLSLSDANGPIANNGTVIITGSVDSILISRIYCTNNSASTINVRVKKEYISVIPGTYNTYCWGNCYDSSLYISGITVPIGAGATDTSNFIGDYNGHGIPGSSTIKYTFYDDANPTDEVSVNVQYSGTVGLDVLLSDVDFSAAYPNPATNQVSFNYSLPVGISEASIIIRDILGNTVKKSLITDQEGKIVMNTKDLTNGMYFYSVVVNEKMISSRKLVISR